MAEGQAAKWAAYYDSGVLPWDSNEACRLLVATTRPEEESDQRLEVLRKPLPLGEAWDEGLVAELEKEVGELRVAAAGLQQKDSTSGQTARSVLLLNGLELSVAIAKASAVRAMRRELVETQLAFRMKDALQHYDRLVRDELADVARELEASHESVSSMYASRYADALLALRGPVREDLKLGVGQMKTVVARSEAVKRTVAREALVPHFAVGTRRDVAAWRCLELGCGTGASAVYLGSLGAHVAAIDLLPQPLRLASARASAHALLGIHVAFLLGDVLTLSDPLLPHLSVDACIAASRGYMAGDGGGDGAARGLTLADALGRSAASQGSGDRRSEARRKGGVGGDGDGAGGVLGGEANGGLIDFILDVQCFHVVREIDETAAVRAVSRQLAPGGLYMVMTGNDGEPAAGPAVLFRAGITFPFRRDFDLLALSETRFDATREYAKLSGPPLAWCALFRRRVLLDVRGCGSVPEAWALLLTALRAPAAHPPSFPALQASLVGDENGVQRPFTIRVGGVRAAGAVVEAWVERLRAVLDGIGGDGCWRDGREAKVIVED